MKTVNIQSYLTRLKENAHRASSVGMDDSHHYLAALYSKHGEKPTDKALAKHWQNVKEGKTTQYKQL